MHMMDLPWKCVHVTEQCITGSVPLGPQVDASKMYVLVPESKSGKEWFDCLIVPYKGRTSIEYRK